MIVDACAFVGSHPFVHSHNHSVPDLLRLMARVGIDRAAVSPLAGAFYQNVQEANEDLFARIVKHTTLLMLVAAINPAYPGWERNLKHSAEKLHAVGIRLFPGYHSYELTSPEVSALAETAGKVELPVFISIRLWDERQHPPTCMVPAVPVKSIVDLAIAHPTTKFVLSMGRFGEITAALKETSEAGNLFADIAGVQGPTNCMRKLIADVGSERLLFGTEMMLQYALPARYKIDYGNLSDDERRGLYAGNLGSILSINAVV
jgi:predicted TIM-barrel fold metal-dependent hydrolase